MASKNISITNDVYEELSKIKLSHESFSDVIHRLIQESAKDPMKYFGDLKDIPEEEWNIYENNFQRLKDQNIEVSKRKAEGL